jgi:hypothetical protein
MQKFEVKAVRKESLAWKEVQYTKESINTFFIFIFQGGGKEKSQR